MANNVTRFDPFSEIARFDPFNGVDQWFRDFNLRPTLRNAEIEPRIKMDVNESDAAYTVKAEIPGVKKDDIKVDVSGNEVSISAELKRDSEEKHGQLVRSERYYGQQRRSFTVACPIDESAVTATYKEGVLEISLPKKSGKSAKQVSIN